MIIAHLADFHLGYRAYNRVGPNGVNQREADVAAAFAEAMATVIHLRPDLVLIAGDVFHSVRPSNGAIAEAFRGLASLAAHLPGVPVVMIAGDRDTPRSADTETILTLFREIPGVVVVTEEAERVALETIDTSVLALPHAALVGAPIRPIEAVPGSGTNVLLLHGTLTGAVADRTLRHPPQPGGARVREEAVGPAGWDYIALGHHAIATELAPNMWYSGGTERTSQHIWAEAAVEKGFLSYDTERRAATFHPLSNRAVVDLPRVSARDRSAAEVDIAIAAAVESIPGGVAGKIVQLVITDVPRELSRGLDHGRIRAYRSEALHFLLDTRPPEPDPAAVFGASRRGQSLEHLVEEYLIRHWTPTMEAIDRRRLVALARGYLEQANERGES